MNTRDLTRRIRRELRRTKFPIPWTLDDIDIAAHLPDWLRADYKVADRIAADNVLATVIGGHDGQVTKPHGNSGVAESILFREDHHHESAAPTPWK